MTKTNRPVLLGIMLLGCLIAFSGAAWDAFQGDWAWRHWVSPMLLLVCFEINRRQSTR